MSSSPEKSKVGKKWYRNILVYGLPAVVISFIYGFNPLNETLLSYWELTGKYPLYTSEKLSEANTPEKPLLVVIGRIFDVSKGRKHYVDEGDEVAPYKGFCGKDGSRAFATGDFSDLGFTDDLTNLKPSQCLAILDWIKFYQNDPKYVEVGKLVGRFYDQRGDPTPALRQFESCVEEGIAERAKDEELKKMYPSCNSKWSKESGSEFW
eukprot:CAMPEP_0171454658 /NCGR_PEP_ID=MMETSP0945-20130129/1857_1 /TAXON_ID=109269 /ORGANISM="Vaucheria litorea, Strain CCMP2940" /LENGTH=207 /DNA_ID=CAMNT_0011979727 /DNA_START=76 /DNA_END=696 /DNA_ORIENTATION=+